MQQPATFQVYNASAGSGKTFTLVKQYLKIVLNSEDIFRFQKILAITFTNKAAGEMKERILLNLEEFSKGNTTDIYPKILEETALDKHTIQERSKKILDAILQNYAAFSITTIDSFTHKIIKNFAFDLGLSLNFEVELDGNSLLNEAVDVLISKIGIDKELTNLLINYSLDKIDEDKSWDISNDLNEFAKVLLKEDDIPHFKKLSKKPIQDFIDLKKHLFHQQKDIKEALKKAGEDCLHLIAKNNLEFSDFTRSSIPKFFLDVSTKSVDFNFLSRSQTIEKAIDNHQYYTKSTTTSIAETIENIVPDIVEFYKEAKKIYGAFLLNKLVAKNLIPLAVLNKINFELNAIKEDNNIQLNSEFNQLISENIKEQPAPFIYERIGQRLQHYFIDEMQDTSVLQWQNLIPLIDNALAQENSNLLLVGDGKQAIYRWRGGKAEQFIELGSEEENPFHIPKEKKQLETNFRSYSEIINFNNSFFKHTANFLQNESYKNLFLEGNKQLENNKKGGFVSIDFLEEEKDKELKKKQYPKKVLEKIKELKNNFSLNEICVLVRKRKDGVAVANYLSENGVNIISSETLLLQNSVKVKFIIDVLKMIQNPADEETKFELLYFLHQHLNISIEKHLFFIKYAKTPFKNIVESLNEYDVSFDISTFQQLPFYEKIEAIIRGFNLINSSDAYVQFFLDVVLEQQRKATDIHEFLEFWEQKKDTLSIVAPESGNAVQIMTIHKSKGLEFPVVIFPCDVDIYRQIKPKVWLNNLPENFNGFDELYVDYNKNISVVSDRGLEIFNQQRQELELDNFNLLYVALTRAEEQLYIITEKKLIGKNKIEDLKYYSGIFINYLKQQNVWKDDVLTYSFGDKNRKSKQQESNSITEVHNKFISTSWKEHNMVLLASSSKLWNTTQGDAIDYGNLFHEILSKIHTNLDVDTVVNSYYRDGFLNEIEFIKIKNTIDNLVNHPKLKKYYSKDVIIYNEREIVDIDNQIIIPDRLVFDNDKVIIIDYKTGEKSKEHQQQLLRYENVLKSMNFKIDKKILIYLYDKIDVITY